MFFHDFKFFGDYVLEKRKCYPILTGRALAKTTKELTACPEIERKKR